MRIVLRRFLPIIVLMFLLGLIIPLVAQDDMASDLDAHKTTLMQFWEAEALRDYSQLNQFFAVDFVRHSAATVAIMPEVQVTSRSEYRQFLRETATTFPDYYTVPQILIAEGDYVAFQALFVGTFVENGNHIEVPMMGVARFENGLIAELWVEWDNLTWNNQMMAEPPVYTETPVSSIADVAGVWRIYGGNWAFFLSLGADGNSHLGSADCEGDTCDDVGEYEIVDNQIHFLSASGEPECYDSYYDVSIVMDGNDTVGLHFHPTGDDCNSGRAEALSTDKIVYRVID